MGRGPTKQHPLRHSAADGRMMIMGIINEPAEIRRARKLYNATVCMERQFAGTDAGPMWAKARKAAGRRLYAARRTHTPITIIA